MKRDFASLDSCEVSALSHLKLFLLMHSSDALKCIFVVCANVRLVQSAHINYPGISCFPSEGQSSKKALKAQLLPGYLFLANLPTSRELRNAASSPLLGTSCGIHHLCSYFH